MIRLLGEPDLDPLVDHLWRHARESGKGGAPIFSPHTPGKAPDRERLRARRRAGWLLAPTEVGWERTWGYVDGGNIVGHAELHGGKLPSELHRATLGMGIEAAYRGKGIGTDLLRAVLDWARGQPTLAWVDLGVFAGNSPAVALYRKLGFREVGRVTDRFRIGANSVDDVMMTIALRE